MLVLIHFPALNTQLINCNNNNFQLFHLHLAFPSFVLAIVSYIGAFFFILFCLPIIHLWSFLRQHFSLKLVRKHGSASTKKKKKKYYYFLRITNQDEILKAEFLFSLKWERRGYTFLKKQNIPRAESIFLKSAMLPGLLGGGCLSSEFPGTLSFPVHSHTAWPWPGRTELWGPRNQHVSEEPIDENSGILVPRSAAKV